MPLESGEYYISWASFANGEFVTRPLGAGQGQNAGEVVVLPPNTPPLKWLIQKLDNDFYALTLDGINARLMDGALRLSPVKLPVFPWRIAQSAPHPPPIGNNAYAIHVPGERPQQSWFIPNIEGDQADEVPVLIESVASSILILPA